MVKKNKAAQSLAALSVEARKDKWGNKGFRKKMQTWGKLGGRPKGENPCTRYPSHRFNPKTNKCYGCGFERQSA